MRNALILCEAWQRQIADEACASFPRECCGLLEGIIADGGVQVHALHPARNICRDDDRFEIDPADHFDALRSARAAGRHIVGCYHSHPNGKAEPSPRDGDSEDGFVWLIAAVGSEGIALAVFQREAAGWRKCDLLAENTQKAA